MKVVKFSFHDLSKLFIAANALAAGTHSFRVCSVTALKVLKLLCKYLEMQQFQLLQFHTALASIGGVFNANI